MVGSIFKMSRSHPLVAAARRYKEEMVSYLLNLPCIDPNMGDTQRTTPLHWACYYNSKLVRLLVDDPRVDVKPVEDGGRQSMHRAAEMGNLEAVKILLADPRVDPWAKLEGDSTWKGKGMIDLALACKHKHVVEYLRAFRDQRRNRIRKRAIAVVCAPY
jgi:ankyrin repeat protein